MTVRSSGRDLVLFRSPRLGGSGSPLSYQNPRKVIEKSKLSIERDVVSSGGSIVDEFVERTEEGTMTFFLCTSTK